MGIKKAPNEFIAYGCIFDGARTFPGVTSSSDNYEEIRDISILPFRAEKDEPLTEEGQCALRSKLGD